MTCGSAVNPWLVWQIIKEYREAPHNYADQTVEYKWDTANSEAKQLVCLEEPEDGFLPVAH